MSYATATVLCNCTLVSVKCESMIKHFTANQNRNNVRVYFMSNAQPKLVVSIKRATIIYIHMHCIYIYICVYIDNERAFKFDALLLNTNTNTIIRNAWIKMNEGVGKVYRLSFKSVSFACVLQVLLVCLSKRTSKYRSYQTVCYPNHH